MKANARGAPQKESFLLMIFKMNRINRSLFQLILQLVTTTILCVLQSCCYRFVGFFLNAWLIDWSAKNESVAVVEESWEKNRG